MENIMDLTMMAAATRLMTALTVSSVAACLLLMAAWALAGITKPCR